MHWSPCVWSLFLVFDLGLRFGWSFVNRLKNFWILRFWTLLPEPDRLDLKAPLVAVVEDELHLDAESRERLSYRDSLNAMGFAPAFQVGKKFAAHRGLEDVVA